MNFEATSLKGCLLIKPTPYQDSRGSFCRTFCVNEFLQQGLESTFVQGNICINNESGLLRGMHYQKGDYAETKLVRCVKGVIYDVVIDLRPDSITFLHWYAVELSESNGYALYVPKGFAHGYQTLTANSIVHYMVSSFYQPDAESGIRYNDPKISIAWPLPVTHLSAKDSTWPLL